MMDTLLIWNIDNAEFPPKEYRCRCQCRGIERWGVVEIEGSDSTTRNEQDEDAKC